MILVLERWSNQRRLLFRFSVSLVGVEARLVIWKLILINHRIVAEDIVGNFVLVLELVFIDELLVIHVQE